MTAQTTLTEEDVLEAFAMEADHGRATIDGYLRDHPAHASALVALSFELSRSDLRDRESHADEEALVERAWERRRAATPAGAENPIAALAPRERQALARDLGVKTQVVSLFREGQIAVETVPERFLARLAGRLGIALDELRSGLAMPGPAVAQSFKSDGPPKVGGPVTFVQALRQSGATEGDVADLASDS